MVFMVFLLGVAALFCFKYCRDDARTFKSPPFCAGKIGADPAAFQKISGKTAYYEGNFSKIFFNKEKELRYVVRQNAWVLLVEPGRVLHKNCCTQHFHTTVLLHATYFQDNWKLWIIIYERKRNVT